MEETEIKAIFGKSCKTKEDLYVLREVLCDENQILESKVWCEDILSFAKNLAKISSHEDVYNFLRDSFNAYSKNYPRRFMSKMEILYELAECSYICGRKNDLRRYVKDFLYNSLSVEEVNNVNTDMGFYSFRGFSEYSLMDIANETISVAHPRMFNDPLDTLLEWWLSHNILDKEENFCKEFSILLRRACEHIKLRCLIGDNYGNKKKSVEDLPILMWSHYADSHKGFCARYEFSEDIFVGYNVEHKRILKFICPVLYNDINLPFDIVPSMKNGIFTKSKEWEYENEMRLLYLNLEDGDKEQDFPVIECKDAIKEVYLGVKCSDSDRQRMEKAVRNLDVKLYSMHIDENNPTKLKKIRIG